MLTVKQVAERLRISISGVYALIASGKLASYSIGAHGGNLRVSEADLEQYLDGCRNSGVAAPIKVAPRKLKHLRL